MPVTSMIRASCILAILGLCVAALHAQEPERKGRLELCWGWNRSAYTRSDIRFHGRDHDFTLRRVLARDSPEPLGLDPYLNPVKLTIPQTNASIAWFFHDRWSVAWRFDHMKYVLVQDQEVAIDGVIHTDVTGHAGTYAGERVAITEDLLTYENSDGLNYINLEIARHGRLAESRRHALALDGTAALAVGALVPRTAARLLGRPLNDRYHLSGAGASLKLGAAVVYRRTWTLRTEMLGGFIALPDIRPSRDRNDRASHKFWFTQANVQFGARIRLVKARVVPVTN
ncbi:MAG: hypothetical protein KIT10_03945 [Flavobacteriales bacterium]|nr:hypothetical protein [Flavobacteriales bacterium]